MSSGTQSRGRRFSCKQPLFSADVDQRTDKRSFRTSLREPTAFIETPKRPILISTPTNSSFASGSSTGSTRTLFDEEVTSRENSPTTPPDDYSIRDVSTERDVADPFNADEVESPVRPKGKKKQVSFRDKRGAIEPYDTSITPTKPHRMRKSIASLDHLPQQEKQSAGRRRSSATTLPSSNTSRIETQSPGVVKSKKPQIQEIDFLPFKCENGRPKERKTQEERDININLYSRILKGDTYKSKELGWIYVFEPKSPEAAPGHVKIGHTKGGPKARMKIWAGCNIPLVEVTDPNLGPFDHRILVETLIAIELVNSRKKYVCEPCTEKKRKEEARKATKKAKTAVRFNMWVTLDDAVEEDEVDEDGDYESEDYDDEDNDDEDDDDDDNDSGLVQGMDDVKRTHVEWYEIDRETALRTVKKWRDWIIVHEPFDSEGKLKSYWEWRVEKISKSLGNMTASDWELWTQRGEAEDFSYKLHIWDTVYFPFLLKVRLYCFRKDQLFWKNCFPFLEPARGYDEVEIVYLDFPWSKRNGTANGISEAINMVLVHERCWEDK